MRKDIGVVVIICVVSAVLWWRHSYRNVDQLVKKENIHVKIADLPVADGWPLYVAMEKGYFKEAGIDVERVRLDAPNLIIDALLSGNVDMSSTSAALGITALAEAKKQGSLQIYAISGGDTKQPSDVLIARRDDTSIQSIADLRGKRVGVLPGIQWRTIATHVFGQAEMKIDQDITLVELAPGLQVSALASKQVDALLTIEPMLTIADMKGIGRELTKGPVIHALDSDRFYGGAGVIRTEFAQQHPEVAHKIMQVMAHAIDDIRNNPDAVRPYLKNYTALEEDAIIAKVPIPTFKMYNKITTEDKNAVQKFYDIFTTYKVSENPLDFEHLLYREGGK